MISMKVRIIFEIKYLDGMIMANKYTNIAKLRTQEDMIIIT